MNDSFPNPDPPSRRIADGLAKLGQALRSHSWLEGQSRRLTPTQGKVLAHLSIHEGTGLQEVAASLGIRAATASEAVRVLAEKGWVEKSRSASDRRALQLRLTQEGRKIGEETLRWPELLARTVSELDEQSQRVLLRSVIHMIHRLQEQGAIPVARLCVTCRHFRRSIHADPVRPHHCALIDKPFGEMDLRVDCPEHLARTESL